MSVVTIPINYFRVVSMEGTYPSQDFGPDDFESADDFLNVMREECPGGDWRLIAEVGA